MIKVGLIVAGAVAVYAVFVGILYVTQDSFLYHPMQRGSETAELTALFPEMKEVSYFLPSGEKLYAWYRPAKKGKKTVIYFHGNAYNVEHHGLRQPVKMLYEKGYGILLPEYRGYGDLKGKPSQSSMEEDAETAVKYLNGQGIRNKDIVLYGHSMGTYLSVYTSAKRGREEAFAGVVLEAPFYSAESVGERYFYNLVPVKQLLKNKYPSYRYIGEINTRLMIAHGKKDKIVPFEEGWQLYNEASEPKTFFATEKAGHNNLSDYGFADAMADWLAGK